jgi:hypothetical protein
MLIAFAGLGLMGWRAKRRAPTVAQPNKKGACIRRSRPSLRKKPRASEGLGGGANRRARAVGELSAL